MLDLKLIIRSDEDPINLKFFVSIEDWTDRGMQLLINFTSPLVVSKGRNEDAIIIEFKDPDMFVSKETGQNL